MEKRPGHRKGSAASSSTNPPKPAIESMPDPMPALGPDAPNSNEKLASMQAFRADPTGQVLSSDHGVQIPHTDDSLRAGERGPTIMEDFHFREKMTRFDHERIPERVVHARGSGAHGFFQVYKSMEEYTKAAFLCDPSRKTPVFVRFSTVVGSRGSADTVRDARGFAVRFYTKEGNFDIVGNNIPVFFIQDGIKFPDLIHAIKPEPAHEMPQAASAHDTFWDFVSLVPETAHMVMWVMSDRALPRSYRMMEGFGVHTFRLVNEKGVAHLVKFHWKPLLGAHSLVWDEAQKLAGKDPDFHRRDLWNAIETGAFPEYELGLQILDEGDELKYGFDLLDATKLVPEELVPVTRVGKLTLDRNPQNFFAETEQIAFHTANIVPGIDFTNDPLLQARLFSYLDTQLTRLGGPNFVEIPINKPIAPVHNHQQDGFHRDTINTGRANYHPNSIGGGSPALAGNHHGFMHFTEKVDGHKIRKRSDSFLDHFSQASLFLNSLSSAERRHLVDACRFELGKVTRKPIRERVLGLFREIDPKLAEEVAAGIGVAVPASMAPPPPGTAAPTHRSKNGGIDVSPALSLDRQPKKSIKTRKIAVITANAFGSASLKLVREALRQEGAVVEVVSTVLGSVTGDDGSVLDVDKTFLTGASVFYDALFVPGGSASVALLRKEGNAIHFVQEAFAHCKAVGALDEGVDLLASADLAGIALAPAQSTSVTIDKGVVSLRGQSGVSGFANALVAAIAQHRHWERASLDPVSA